MQVVRFEEFVHGQRRRVRLGWRRQARAPPARRRRRRARERRVGAHGREAVATQAKRYIINHLYRKNIVNNY